MSEKVFNLVSNIIDGTEIISVAVVSFCVADTTISAAVNASILIVGTAITNVCKQFVKA